MVFTMPWTPTGTFPHPMVMSTPCHLPGMQFPVFVSTSARLGALHSGGLNSIQTLILWCCQARMLYTYKLPNGVLRLSDKAEYFADASDAYHSLAKVLHLYYYSQSPI